MNTSSRFVVATHILTALHVLNERGIGAVKSDFLAESVNTNPVVIRRILGQLRKSGLVLSQVGAGGGFSLGRSAGSMTLLDIHRSVEVGSLYHFHYKQPNQSCPIGCTIQDVLQSVFSDAESAVEGVLRGKTLLDMADQMMATAKFQECAALAEAEGRAPSR
jgi:Rrf2 family protein